MAEDFRILKDVDKTIHGEMKLSEYIKRWGTIYVDEKFMPLLTRERIPPKDFGIKFYTKKEDHE